MKTYKRIIAARRGGPEVLQLIEEKMTEPRHYQARIKILTAGVSFADVLMREGVYIGMPKFPFSPGYDIVGIVDQVGSKVSKVRRGQIVAALTVTGGYSQYIFLNEDELIIVPDDIAPEEAVSVVLNYITAYQMLHRTAKIKKGEKILIHGAAGGVGTALLQLGKLHELKMFGTASTGKLALIKKLGGIPIDYKNENFVKSIRKLTGDGVDAVFEGTGELGNSSYKTLREGGRLIIYGISSMLINGRRNIFKVIGTYLRLSIFLRNIIPNRKKVLMYQITKYKKQHPEWFREDLLTLFDLLKEKKINPVIAEKIHMEKAAEAHRLLNKSSIGGKIVLICNQ